MYFNLCIQVEDGWIIVQRLKVQNMVFIDNRSIERLSQSAKQNFPNSVYAIVKGNHSDTPKETENDD